MKDAETAEYLRQRASEDRTEIEKLRARIAELEKQAAIFDVMARASDPTITITTPKD